MKLSGIKLSPPYCVATRMKLGLCPNLGWAREVGSLKGKGVLYFDAFSFCSRYHWSTFIQHYSSILTNKWEQTELAKTDAETKRVSINENVSCAHALLVLAMDSWTGHQMGDGPVIDAAYFKALWLCGNNNKQQSVEEQQRKLGRSPIHQNWLMKRFSVNLVKTW